MYGWNGILMITVAFEQICKMEHNYVPLLKSKCIHIYRCMHQRVHLYNKEKGFIDPPYLSI